MKARASIPLIALLTVSSGLLANVPTTSPNTSSIMVAQAQTNNVFTTLRNQLIQKTPLVQAQLDQLTDDELQYSVARAGSLTPGPDPEAVYNQLVIDYPQVFASELTRIKEALVKEGLIMSELDQLNQADILWEEFIVFESNQNTENFPALATSLANKYHLNFQASNHDAEAIRNVLIESTPITKAQLDLFTDKDLEAALDNHLKENVTGGDPSTLYGYLFNNFPEVFKSEVQRIRTGVMNATGLTSTFLDQVPDYELMWEELRVFNANGQVEDFKALGDSLVEIYGSTQTDPAILRQKLIDQTPMIKAQLDQFTDETILGLYKTLENSGQGGDPVTMFNHLVANHPQVFQGEYDRIYNLLVSKYGINGQELAQLGISPLLWEEFNIWSNTQQEDLPTLAIKLIQDNPQMKATAVTVTTKSGDKAQLPNTGEKANRHLPNTGEKANWLFPVVGIGVLILGIGLLVGKKKSNRE